MMNDKPRIKTATAAFEKSLQEKAGGPYVLRLFVSGMTPSSLKAIRNIREICEKHLKGNYELEIIDIYQHPEQAKNEHIVAAPTLIKKLPAPLRKFIGDLSDSNKILVGLEIVPKNRGTDEKKE